ncbi:MAG: hypothetical protein EB060_00885 [Proteobacteria bacterium]|nr:hypothetical protein [Pseudomonadota bacterium]
MSPTTSHWTAEQVAGLATALGFLAEGVNKAVTLVGKHAGQENADAMIKPISDDMTALILAVASADKASLGSILEDHSGVLSDAIYVCQKLKLKYSDRYAQALAAGGIAAHEIPLQPPPRKSQVDTLERATTKIANEQEMLLIGSRFAAAAVQALGVLKKARRETVNGMKLEYVAGLTVKIQNCDTASELKELVTSERMAKSLSTSMAVIKALGERSMNQALEEFLSAAEKANIRMIPASAETIRELGGAISEIRKQLSVKTPEMAPAAKPTPKDTSSNSGW